MPYTNSFLLKEIEYLIGTSCLFVLLNFFFKWLFFFNKKDLETLFMCISSYNYCCEKGKHGGNHSNLKFSENLNLTERFGMKRLRQ